VRVVDLVRRHRPDEAQLIGHRADVRQPVAHRRAAPAVPAEGRAPGHDELLLVPRHGGEPLSLTHAVRQFAARPSRQPGFMIEQFQLRRPTRLGEENHPLGPRGKVPRLRRRAGQRIEGHGPQTQPGLLQKQTPAQVPTLRLGNWWLIHG
jgi:hypothetical protein